MGSKVKLGFTLLPSIRAFAPSIRAFAPSISVVALSVKYKSLRDWYWVVSPYAGREAIYFTWNFFA